MIIFCKSINNINENNSFLNMKNNYKLFKFKI